MTRLYIRVSIIALAFFFLFASLRACVMADALAAQSQARAAQVSRAGE